MEPKEMLSLLSEKCKAGKVIRNSDKQKLTDPTIKYLKGRPSYDFTVTSKKTGRTKRQDYWIEVFDRYVTILN